MPSHGFSGGMHGGVRGPTSGFRASGAGNFHGGVRPGWGFHGRPFGDGFHHHHFYPGWGWGWGGYWYPYAWGWGYPWAYGDLGWYDNGGYATQYYTQENYSNQYQDSEAQAQQDEIDRLNDEVANLREQRESESRASRAPRPPKQSESTELVYRDKHTEEIQNYAVVGQTLWVLTQQRARRIPIAELDVPATERANEARGIEFSIPR